MIVLVSSNDIEDVEQKKRGVAKTTTLNAIPSGAQKPDYTYSIYTQNPNSQASPNPTYSQSQVPNSFYPSQPAVANQFYSPPNSHDQSQIYPPQSQLNLIPPPSSQFLPLNLLQNQGYQTKFQIIPSKTQNGNIQLAIIPQQPSLVQPNFLSLQQSYFSPQPNQINPQQNQIPSQGNYQFGSNFQQFPFSQPYAGHPSTMLLYAQPNPYSNNYLLPNPSQQLYNYYQSNPQNKYLYSGAEQTNVPPQAAVYEKYQNAITSQPASKDDNEINIHGTDYINPAESATNYKSSYTTGRGSSYKRE